MSGERDFHHAAMLEAPQAQPGKPVAQAVEEGGGRVSARAGLKGRAERQVGLNGVRPFCSIECGDAHGNTAA